MSQQLIISAVERLTSSLELPSIIFFGEIHPRFVDARSTFQSFFLASLGELYKMGFTTLFLELNHRHLANLRRFLTGKIDVSVFRSLCIKPTQQGWDATPNEFFLGLKDFVQRGGQVLPINKQYSGRDHFMSRKILKAMEQGRKCIYFCGGVHALIRRADEITGVWRSSAELVSERIGRQNIFSVAEISNSCYMLRQPFMDENLLALLKGSKQIGFELSKNLETYQDTVIFHSDIGKGYLYFKEFGPEYLIERIRHYDGVYLDTISDTGRKRIR